MKRVHVYFHGNCFDGAASAALFTLFIRENILPDADFKYFPLAHTPGFSWKNVNLDGDVNAVLDFRYAPGKLQWFFDHHGTSFMEPEHRRHFESHLEIPPHFFWDPAAPSNAGFMVKSLQKHYGWQITDAQKKLVEWADMIDSASFPSPDIPVELVEPAVAFARLLENSVDNAETERFIQDLTSSRTLDEMANEPYWSNRINRVRQANWDEVEDIKRVLETRDGTAFIDLSGQERAGFNKFIPYYLAPDVLYSVALLLYRNRYKISVGTNPWHDLRNADPVLDIGALCEKYGGGGHCAVGAVSLDKTERERAAFAAREILEICIKNIEAIKLEQAKKIL